MNLSCFFVLLLDLELLNMIFVWLFSFKSWSRFYLVEENDDCMLVLFTWTRYTTSLSGTESAFGSRHYQLPSYSLEKFDPWLVNFSVNWISMFRMLPSSV